MCQGLFSAVDLHIFGALVSIYIRRGCKNKLQRVFMVIKHQWSSVAQRKIYKPLTMGSF